MKKRRLLLTALAGAMFLTSSIGVLAAEVSNEPSDATIKFVADPSGSAADPVDPEYPQDIIEPEDASEKKAGSGNLTIDYITNLAFGEGIITSKDKTYYAKTRSVTYTDPDTSVSETRIVPNSVQVTDNRGTGSGWKLKVKQSQMQTAEGEFLSGAELTLDNLVVNSTVDSLLTPWPVLNKTSITLKGNNEQELVMTAAVDAGLGTFVSHYGVTRGTPANGDTSVSLFVPGNSTKLAKSYTSILTWTLEDTP